MLHKTVREHQRWITQIIRDGITSNIHRRYLHDHVENIADVSPMCLGYFEPWCIPRRMLADCCALLDAVRQYIADGSWLGRKFQCIH